MQNGSPYLAFVADTIETLLAHQSARLGGAPDGQLFLTVSRPVNRDYRSLGHLRPDGKHQTYWFPGKPMDLQPFIVDFELWPVLQRLGACTGDERHATLVENMAAAFARVGFDERCGLGYLGEEAALDVVHVRNVSRKVGTAEPHFKPLNSGTFPGMPLEVLWRHAPAQMHRMFRAMYLGLVTHPESMDFNRFCDYDFDDAAGEHHMVRCAGHCAFESAAARMIHWWANCHTETGDEDCLAWAERMADKWEAIQHPESGLVPNFFGAVAWAEHVPMPPGGWAETRGAALMAAALLEAVRELRRPGTQRCARLAERLQAMALRLARGVARHAYDPGARLFREHLHLDGRPYAATARYCFHTAAEKAEAVRADPELAQVAVYRGAGFYHPATYWEYCCGVNTPADLAQVAAATGDGELAQLMRPWIDDLLAVSRREENPITAEGSWTFRGSAYGIKMLLLLGGVLGQDEGLAEKARELADHELARLRRPTEREWWRMPERASLLDALLLLDER